MALWGVVGSNSLRTSSDVAAALGGVSTGLQALPTHEIRVFEEELEVQLGLLDLPGLGAAPVLMPEGVFAQTEDHFLYSRCACVLSGRRAVESVLSGDRDFAEFTDVGLQGAEALLYVVSRERHRRAQVDDS